MATNRQAMEQALTRIRLLIKDGVLPEAVAAVDDLATNSEIYGPVFTSRPQTDAAAGSARAAAYAHLNQLDAALRALETKAAKELGDVL